MRIFNNDVVKLANFNTFIAWCSVLETAKFSVLLPRCVLSDFTDRIHICYLYWSL